MQSIWTNPPLFIPVDELHHPTASPSMIVIQADASKCDADEYRASFLSRFLIAAALGHGRIIPDGDKDTFRLVGIQAIYNVVCCADGDMIEFTMRSLHKSVAGGMNVKATAPSSVASGWHAKPLRGYVQPGYIDCLLGLYMQSL